eukprot:scaffold37366_cov18-Tisochrysis_lutea.AAC.2
MDLADFPLPRSWAFSIGVGGFGCAFLLEGAVSMSSVKEYVGGRTGLAYASFSLIWILALLIMSIGKGSNISTNLILTSMCSPRFLVAQRIFLTVRGMQAHYIVHKTFWKELGSPFGAAEGGVRDGCRQSKLYLLVTRQESTFFKDCQGAVLGSLLGAGADVQLDVHLGNAASLWVYTLKQCVQLDIHLNTYCRSASAASGAPGCSMHLDMHLKGSFSLGVWDNDGIRGCVPCRSSHAGAVQAALLQARFLLHSSFLSHTGGFILSFSLG